MKNGELRRSRVATAGKIKETTIELAAGIELKARSFVLSWPQLQGDINVCEVGVFEWVN